MYEGWVDTARVCELYESGLTVPQVARRLRCPEPMVRRRLKRGAELGLTSWGTTVPTAVLRAAYERSGLSLSEVGYWVGWTCKPRGHADVSRVAYTLGLRARRPGQTPAVVVRHRTALALAPALGLDPVDLGL